MQPPDRFGREPGGQPGRVLQAQPADPQDRQIGPVEQGRLSFPDGDQDRDRVGHQAAEGEQERRRARAVEPLGVVDQHGHRRLLGVGAEQAERGGSDRETVLRHRGPQGQGGLQRGGLRSGDRLQQRQGRADELQQRAERDLGFGLDTAGPQHPHSGRLLGGVAEQGRLTDSRFSGQGQHGADAGPRPRQGLLDFPALIGAA